jgi:hypothetical protein
MIAWLLQLLLLWGVLVVVAAAGVLVCHRKGKKLQLQDGLLLLQWGRGGLGLLHQERKCVPLGRGKAGKGVLLIRQERQEARLPAVIWVLNEALGGVSLLVQFLG